MFEKNDQQSPLCGLCGGTLEFFENKRTRFENNRKPGNRCDYNVSGSKLMAGFEPATSSLPTLKVIKCHVICCCLFFMHIIRSNFFSVLFFNLLFLGDTSYYMISVRPFVRPFDLYSETHLISQLLQVIESKTKYGI